jgi:hypothetical protein
MRLKQQYSIGYLCAEIAFVGLGLGFLTILLHAQLRTECQFLVIPLVGACWGAAIGGVWDNMLEGAKGGLLAGFALLLPVMASISSR